MVKFSLIALSGALASANAGSNRRIVKLGNRQLRRGEPTTEALLQRARPYKKSGNTSRRLEGDFEIDGSYSIKFSQCVDIKTVDENLFDENLISYVQAGQVVSTKSYVLFHVCQNNNCYYESDDDLYIVDLPTYLSNVAMYYANQRTNYCEACNEFQDYCNPEEEEAAEGEAEVAEEEDAEAGEEEEENVEEEDRAEEEGAEEEGAEEDEDPEGEDNMGKLLPVSFITI